eukprot:TRINITY_DN12408_c0_g1_i1.p1 TRINITY_DN12408_c0_g1~~TRINITY_DN12408_c0_g1_i1.p1  ORF type:complete len:340 (-),score=67.87 TRINITY_DN12408_c0_g1_i1:73-948(-)
MSWLDGLDGPPPVWASRNDGLESDGDIVSRVRRKINAARMRSNQSWEELFMVADKNRDGIVTYSELSRLVRDKLKLPTQTIPEFELKMLFQDVDQDGSNTVDIAELFEYVQHGKKRPEDEAARLKQRLRRVQKTLAMAFQKLNTGQNEADMRKLFKKLDMDASNRLTLYEFNTFVRMDLKLSRWDVRNGDVTDFFNFLDRNRDGIDVYELMAYIAKNEKDRAKVGAHCFYEAPDMPKARKMKTYRQQLHDGIRRSESLPALNLRPPFVSLGRNSRPTTRIGCNMAPNALYT